MSVNREERNTQIPLEAIEGAADINDIDWGFSAFGPVICCGKDDKEQTKNNTETKSAGHAKRVYDGPMSIALKEGMIIVAKDGGRTKSTKAIEGPEI